MAEVRLAAPDFIEPLFVVEGTMRSETVPGFDGVNRYSPDAILLEIENIVKAGIAKILLFAVVPSNRKNSRANYATSKTNCVALAIREIKERFPRLIVIADLCLCSYTSDGHCGLSSGETILNDETLPVLASEAVLFADAGADYLAPSAMMDGQVAAIRTTLDEQGFGDRGILAYSAKFASSLYGPFRNTLDSAPSFGDRKTYQCDYRNSSLALKEIETDIAEGASIVMVKPALPYLDIVCRAKAANPEITLAAYHVSGEYMLIKNAARMGIVDEQEAFLEAFYAIKRAGADMIVTYYAKEISAIL
jgi:porphobilinogen synthase